VHRKTCQLYSKIISNFLFVFSVANPDPYDPYVFGLPDPDPLIRGTDPDPDLSIIKQKP
jgi:hypothetical protein